MNSLLKATLTWTELCAYLGFADTQMRKQLPDLYAAGFPRKLPVIEVWSRPAVDDWLARNGRPEPVENDTREGHLSRRYGDAA